ncbi:type I secretion C-terminal target domain-containing protein [Vibrio sinensis]|uniref:Type I secretion C-terminal target domain-containing protein n=1 Tax=Vibrio sinensis TaxID=2302434 RepID=A0A3A6QF15_9VIBR|nr:retention module-containing protein [Vibrio sinensis]RJX70965.1 type I secretion C-terminal target domain-containing protein [Vibrio sinensis]
MEVEVVRYSTKVEDVFGDVIAVNPAGVARKLAAGDTLQKGDILLSSNESYVVILQHGKVTEVVENCVACVSGDDTIVVTELSGQVSVDPSAIENAAFDAADIDAIQQAILDGVDPTATLEAAAAGGNLGSANAGFVTIEYNDTQTLASTFFETKGLQNNDEQSIINQQRYTRFADGGESLSEIVTEGSLSQNTYPQTVSNSTLILAGDLPLDADSFVPTESGITALLAELNTDITSSGQTVTFSYDSAENTIIGVLADGSEVIRIDIDTVLVGKDVEMTVTSTVFEPVDHLAAINGGLVSLNNDQVVINIELTGFDLGGNEIQLPINVDVIVQDGVNPEAQPVTITNVESDTATIDGTFVTIGSDALQSVGFDQAALAQFDNLLSNNNPITVTLSNDGTELLVSIEGTGEEVMRITLDTEGNYQFEQKLPLEQSSGDDTVTLALPITITDFDQDTITNVINIRVGDGDIPVITDVTGLSLDESGVQDGSDQGIALTSGAGSVTTQVGSDAINHYELEPNEFNTDGAIQSQGQIVQLELVSTTNGSRFYEGVIELNGSRVTIFDITLDTPNQGEYQFNLYEQLDNFGAQAESASIKLPIYAVDTDGDRSAVAGGTGEAEAAYIVIDVKDDVPVIDTATGLSLEENDLAPIGSDQSGVTQISGSFATTQGADGVVSYRLDTSTNPLGSLTSQGDSVSLIETKLADGSYSYQASTDSEAIFNLLVRPDGSYTFTLQGPIDHALNSDSRSFDFTIIATDFDGDTSSKVLPLSIVDDVPTLTGSSGTLVVDEDDIVEIGDTQGSDGSQPAVISGLFEVAEGADGIVKYEVVNESSVLNGITSNGQAVTWTSDSPVINGEQLVYTAVSANGLNVFTLTLDANDNSYRFELIRPIDHLDGQDENQAVIDFEIKATDQDQDQTSSIRLPITIVDDVATLTGISGVTRVDEDDIAQIGNTVGSDGTQASFASGNFVVTEGADGVIKLALSNQDSVLDGLSSGKEALIWTTNSPVETGEQLVYTAVTTSGNETVFTLTLDASDNSYRFDLIRPLDHGQADGENEITIPFSVEATDKDQDVSNSIEVSITVVDDVPTLSGFTGQNQVDEDDIAQVNSAQGNNSTEGSDGTQSATIGGNFTVVEGADGIVEYQLENQAEVLDGLTSAGADVVWSTDSPVINGEQLVYTAINATTQETVFTFTLDATDNSYQFDLIRPVDHPTADGQNTIVLDMSIVATDADGDKSSAITLPITIVDDVPVLSGFSGATQVDEDDIAQIGNTVGSDGTQDPFAEGNFTVTEGADGIVKFDLVDPNSALVGLTSANETLEWSSNSPVITGEQLVYTAVTSNGQDSVFTITLDASNNSYRFDLIRPLDHEQGNDQNSITIDFKVQASDADGDLTSVITLPITVVDDISVLAGFSGNTVVDEDDLVQDGSDGNQDPFVTGNFNVTEGADGIVRFELANQDSVLDGLVSNQQSVIWTAESPVITGEQYVYTAVTENSADVVFTLTFDASDNSYRFELVSPVTHDDAQSENNQVLNFEVKAVDGDGDETPTIDLPISIVDDVPLISGLTGQQSVNEDDIVLIDGVVGSDGTQSPFANGNFTVTEGADRIVSFELGNQATALTGLTSGGQQLVWTNESPVSNGEQRVYTAITQPGGLTVFTLTLDATDNSYRFDLIRPIDHADVQGDNTKLINFTVTATDSDNDVSAPIDLPITVIDDIPQINTVDPLSFNEDDLTLGSSPQAGELSKDGNFGTIQGADGVVSYRLEGGTDPIDGLTSQGQAITLVETQGPNTGEYTYTASTSLGEVFVLIVRPDGSYTFELKGPIDHESNSDSEQLIFSIVATDADGDISKINLPVTISDDKPVLSGYQGNTQVDEDDIVTIGDTQGSDGTQVPFVSGTFTVVEGADGIVKFELTNQDTALDNLTSAGQDVVWTTDSPVVNGEQLVYTAVTSNGQETVFTLTLNASDNSYRFDLVRPIDHAPADGENSKTLNFDIKGTDVDLDETSSVRLPFTIVDDIPKLTGFTGSTTVDEDDIRANQDVFPSVNGSFDVVEGADGIVKFELDNTLTVIDGLTSGGQNVEWADPIVNGEQIIYTAVINPGPNQVSVFTLTLDATSNTYRFELQKAIDHLPIQGENTDTLTFSIKAVDADSDQTTTINLPINIVDDIPLLRDRSFTVTEDGDRVQTGMFRRQGADGASIVELEGSDTANGQIVFELPDGSFSDTYAMSGNTPNFTVYEAVTTAGVTAYIELGTMQVQSSGRVRFTPVDDLKQESDGFTFVVNFTGKDKDDDTSTEQLTITIHDRNADIKVSTVTSFEDAGRDPSVPFADPIDRNNAQDNQSSLPVTPTQVNLQIDLYDLDNDEMVGDITIKAGDHQGTFYYLNNAGEYVALATDSNGNFVLSAAQVKQIIAKYASEAGGPEDSGISTINNLFFVPDRNTATSDAGITADIEVQILNGGSADHTVDGTLSIEIESVADIATWNDDASTYQYTIVEDADNATLTLDAVTQDGSTPEVITYELAIESGEGQFVLRDADGNEIAETSPGIYIISADQINTIQVDPIEHFSGHIKFIATAITTEQDNALVGKEVARSEPKEIIIDVEPQGDLGRFSVNRITIFEDNALNQDTVNPDLEHDPFTLNEVISMSPSPDLDGSESLYVELSNFTATGVEVRWVGPGDSQIEVITEGGNTIYRVPEEALEFVEIQPPLHSNDNFSFSVEGFVEDKAIVGGETVIEGGSEISDVVSLGEKTVNVTVKGVADIPYIPDVPDVPDTGAALDTWYQYDDGTGRVGAQITINESTEANISFVVFSGELSDGVADNSETVSVLLSNIPDGVELFDANGGTIDLVYVGEASDGSGPIYQANIAQSEYPAGITIKPPAYSTEDLEIGATVVVTENDGHVRQVEGVLKVNVVPVIDAGLDDKAYQRTVTGSEDPVNAQGDDVYITLPWTLPNAESPDSTPSINGRDFEYVTNVELTGFPTGSTVRVNGQILADPSEVDIDGLTVKFDGGKLEIDGLTANTPTPVVDFRPPEDSSTDFTIKSELTIEEVDDNDPSLIVTAKVAGEINVEIIPTVEPDGTLSVIGDNGQPVTLVTDGDINKDPDGFINFSINSATGGKSDANVIIFDDLDPSSVEQVKEIVIRFIIPDGEDAQTVLDQLFVSGAVNNGDGSWTILDEQNFSISAPNGLQYDNQTGPNSQIQIEIVAEVEDLGDENEGSPLTKVTTDLTLQFPSSISGNDSVAAKLEEITTPEAIVIGTEDNAVDVSSQISKLIAVSALPDTGTGSSADGVSDQLTIVIDPTKIPAEANGLVINGAEYDFANNLYIFKGTIDSDGNIVIPDGLEFILPKDYAGDFILPITFVTTDSASGDENVLEMQVPIAVSPLVDVPTSDGGVAQPEDNNVTPEINVSVDSVAVGSGAVEDDKALEDNLIKINLDVAFADSRNTPTQGQETITAVVIKLADSTLGEFVDINGNPITPDSSEFTIASSDPAVIAAALDQIFFMPKENYPTGNDINKVELEVSTTIVDKTDFDTTGTTQITNEGVEKTVTQTVSFEITPVLDSIQIGDQIVPPNDANIPMVGMVVGQEDTDIALQENGTGLKISLIDNDGSEQFLSAKLTGVPDNFLINSTSDDYVIKNSGGGEWVIQLVNPNVTSIDLSNVTIRPPEHFSGKVDIGVTVFTQEKLLGQPDEFKGSFTVEVKPVGDIVDVDPTDAVTGKEGENIDIKIDANIVDKVDLLPADNTQDQPETLLITVENVPDGASIFFPDGTTAGTNLGGGVWQLRVDGQELDKIVFNSGEQNKDTWSQDSLKITVQSVDKDSDGNEYLGPTVNQIFDVAVDVEAINDRPEFNNIANLETSEDTVVAIKGFTISDIDSSLDNPAASYTLTLSVDSGSMTFIDSVATAFNLTVSLDPSTQQIVIQGTVTNINQALEQNLVQYTPPLNSNNLIDTDGVKVSATVNDNGNNGAVDPANPNTDNTNSAEFVINVTEVNDAPVAADLDFGSIEEDTSVIISASQLINASSDIEGHDLTVMSVTVPAEQGTIVPNGAGSWIFQPKLDFNGEVTISYVIEDNGTTNGTNDFKQDTGTISLDVVGKNDAPDLDIDGLVSTIDEAANQLISGIQVSDVDYVDQYANDPMSMTLSVDYGILSVQLPAGSTVSVTQNTDSSITLIGTIGELNALLDSPSAGSGVFVDASFAPDSDIELTILATDSGNPSGIVLPTEKTANITVTPVANAPTLSIDPQFNYIRNVTASQSASNSGIALVGIMAALTDVNELLTLDLTNLPAGTVVETANGVITPDNGVWTIPAAEIDSLVVKNLPEGSNNITLTAVSEEDDNSTASSASISLNVAVTNDSNDIDLSSSTEDVELLGGDTGIELTAGSGNDLLVGGDSDDVLNGGAGNDTLEGGLGSDILTGGTGEDTFVWREISQGATDTITDFSFSDGDKLDLRDLLPELNSSTVNMDDLLSHITAAVSGDDVTLTISPAGTGTGMEQNILLENIGQQVTLDNLDSSQIVTTLFDEHAFVHNGN